MPYYRIKLKPKGPFFIGQNSHARKSTAIVHSDVLHSALICVSAITDTYWLCERATNLKLSSIYPYYKEKGNKNSGRTVFLYPKPFVPSTTDDTNNESINEPYQQKNEEKLDKKRWKKTKYVSEGLFKELLINNEITQSAQIKHLDGADESKASVLCLKEEVDKLKLPNKIVIENYKISTVIDRINNQTTPYPQNFYEINTDEGVGLWFLVELQEDELDKFKKLLSTLGELGLGGERTSGFGHFSVQSIELFTSEHIIVENGLLKVKGQEQPYNAAVTLSLYHPTKEEFERGILTGIASYECTVRGGWIHSIAGYDSPKQSIRMCIEGSVFPAINGMPYGDVTDISYDQNPHPIYRSGLAFNIYFYHASKEEN